jgi:hypothetical protein
MVAPWIALLLRAVRGGLLCLVTAMPAVSDPSAENAAGGFQFLKEGLPIDAKRLNLSDRQRAAYERAIASRPSIQACIDRSLSAPESWVLDLSDRWTVEELEVCLFWAARIAQAEGLRSILRNSGFTLNADISYPASAMQRYGMEGDGVLVDATLSRKAIPRSLHGPLDWIVAPHGLSVGILLSGDGKPISVSVSLIRK